MKDRRIVAQKRVEAIKFFSLVLFEAVKAGAVTVTFLQQGGKLSVSRLSLAGARNVNSVQPVSLGDGSKLYRQIKKEVWLMIKSHGKFPDVAESSIGYLGEFQASINCREIVFSLTTIFVVGGEAMILARVT